MEDILIPVVFVLFFGLVIWMNIAIFGKSQRLIREWADSNGYSIIATELRFLRKGPFTWTSSRGQTVYYVTVQTPEGVMNAYVRCGSFWVGLLSDKIDVKWD